GHTRDGSPRTLAPSRSPGPTSTCSAARTESRTPRRSSPGSAPSSAEAGASGQFADRLLEHPDRLRHPVAEARADDADVLDHPVGTGGQALELGLDAQLGELPPLTPEQDEASEVAPVRLQERGLEALDRPFLLQPSVVLHRLVEQVEALGFAAPN